MANEQPTPESDDRPSRRLLPYGEQAVLLECADLADAQAVHRWLTTPSAEDAAVIAPVIGEIVPGACTLLLRLTAPLPSAAAETLTRVRPPRRDVTATTTVEVVVDYNGADVDQVADSVGLTADDLVDWHTGQDWTVAFCGFAPGFGYLMPTVQARRIPRRSTPRTQVPAGSVALADQWSAVYPNSSPGGWQLIGSTDVPLFDASADPPARLRPGMRVRFRRARADGGS